MAHAIWNLLTDYDLQEIMEKDFADWPVLLLVGGFDDALELDKILTRIPGLELLRRDTRPD